MCAIYRPPKRLNSIPFLCAETNQRRRAFVCVRMRTLTTLSESVLGAHSPPSLPKSAKPHLPCPDPSSKKRISLSEVRSRNRSAVSPGYSRYFCINMYPEWFGNFLQAAPANSHGIDFSRKSYKATSATAFLHSLYHDDASNTSQGMLQLGNESSIARNKSFIRLMMFVLLFGFFTNSGSQQAIAGSDFSGGMQSDSFLGDFGDISTGDKTFFIAALLAARNSAAVVFTGTFGALSAMTLISVFLGRTFHYVDEILPFRFGETDVPIDDIAAACLLVYFGVSTLFEATSSDGLKAEDEQKEAELAVSEISENGTGILAATKTVISTFLLVFVAEWGDKSFFSTIALAAAASPPGVIGGALAGHGAATLLAVLGGSLLGIFLSEKVIAYIGGVLFLVFAAVTLVEIIS